MNYFVKFLIDNAKTVANILKVVVSVTDFLAEAGIQIFNAQIPLLTGDIKQSMPPVDL